MYSIVIVIFFTNFIFLVVFVFFLFYFMVSLSKRIYICHMCSDMRFLHFLILATFSNKHSAKMWLIALDHQFNQRGRNRTFAPLKMLDAYHQKTKCHAISFCRNSWFLVFRLIMMLLKSLNQLSVFHLQWMMMRSALLFEWIYETISICAFSIWILIVNCVDYKHAILNRNYAFSYILLMVLFFHLNEK